MSSILKFHNAIFWPDSVCVKVCVQIVRTQLMWLSSVVFISSVEMNRSSFIGELEYM